MDKTTTMDMWFQPPQSPASKARSLTSRGLQLCQRLGLLREPAEAALSWRPTVLLVAWTAAPIIVIACILGSKENENHKLAKISAS